jgi:hypothetical protein
MPRCVSAITERNGPDLFFDEKQELTGDIHRNFPPLTLRYFSVKLRDMRFNFMLALLPCEVT